MKKLAPYKFCPVCGGKLKKKFVDEDHNERLICKDCSYTFYINSKPTVNAVILDKQGNLLLTKRGVPPAKGKWDFAGGFLENGEDPKKGLRREIKEELGVDCKVGDFVDIHVSVFPSLYREGTFNVYYFVTLKSLKVQALSDVDEVRWFPLKEIKESMMSYSGGWKVVEKVKSLKFKV